MKGNFHALIIDDHPIIADAYESALKKLFSKDYNLSTKILDNIDAIIRSMEDPEFLSSQDLILLDIKLPPAKDKSLLSGEDIGVEIRKRDYKGKIIVSTTFNDNYRLYSIMQNVDPDGFLVKNDINPNELLNAIDCVLKDPPYYSKTVLQLLRKQISNDFVLDNIDRRLLYELSCGTKMKELPEFLPLSIAGIERRKRSLKIIFDVENEGDRGLVEVARKKGFL